MNKRNGNLPFIFWPQVYEKIWPVGLMILFFGGLAANTEESMLTYKIVSFCIVFYLGFGVLLYLYRFINNLVWVYRDGKKKDFYLYLVAIAATIIAFGIIFAVSTK